jgi:hypothetical protein
MQKTDEFETEIARASERVREICDSPSHYPVPGTVSATANASGRRIRVSYVAHDPYPPTDFWRGKAVRRSFATGELAAVFTASKATKNAAIIGIDNSGPEEHAVPYDRHLDLVAIPKNRLGSADPIAAAERLLRAHQAWRKGETFGVVTETFSVDRDGCTSRVDVEAAWAHVDMETAMEIKNSMAKATDRDAEPEPSSFAV